MAYTLFTKKQLEDASGLTVNQFSTISVVIKDSYCQAHPDWKLTTFHFNNGVVLAWPDVSLINISTRNGNATLRYSDEYPRRLIKLSDMSEDPKHPSSRNESYTLTPNINVLDTRKMNAFPKDGTYIIGVIRRLIERHASKPETILAHIVATTESGLIGIGDKLPWKRFSPDLKFFKAKTLNNVVLMGRKTVDSIPSKLPDRKIVMVTKSDDTRLKDRYDEVYSSIDDAVISNGGVIYIAGGQSIYEQTLPAVDVVYRNIIHTPVLELEGKEHYYPILELEDRFNLLSEEDTDPDEDGRYMTKQIWIAK